MLPVEKKIWNIVPVENLTEVIGEKKSCPSHTFEKNKLVIIITRTWKKVKKREYKKCEPAVILHVTSRRNRTKKNLEAKKGYYACHYMSINVPPTWYMDTYMIIYPTREKRENLRFFFPWMKTELTSLSDIYKKYTWTFLFHRNIYFWWRKLPEHILFLRGGCLLKP